MLGQNLISLGILVIIIGIFIIFLGTFLSSTGNQENNSTIKGGGVIMIGPIPIIFGTDRSSIMIGVVLAIILMIVSYLLFYRN
jgi:uncharacterized protein (TIGR00304 family)